MNAERAGIVAAGVVALFCFVASAFGDDAHTIVQQGRGFHPGDVIIRAGETLDFPNRDEFIHQIYVDTPGFSYDSEEQQPGQTFHIRFPNAGTYQVKCHIHPKMLLIVHVQ
jgi:plastocyanin